MNAKTLRALEVGQAAFSVIRTKGTMEYDEQTRDIRILWAEGGSGLCGRLFTQGLRVHLEVWKAERVLAISRITGATDFDVSEYTPGSWERCLLALAPPQVH